LRYVDLCELAPEGGRRKRLTTDGHRRPGAYSSPSLTRDGQRLAYVRGGRAFVAQRNVSQSQRVSNRASVEDVAISADGRNVAFVRVRFRCPDDPRMLRPCDLTETIFVRDLPTGTERRLRIGSARDPEWDDEHVLVVLDEAEGSIWAVDPHGRDPAKRLLHNPDRRFSDPVLSPDGKRLAVVELTPEGPNRIAIYALGAPRPPRYVSGSRLDRSPSWSPDGTRLVFSRDGVLHTVSAAGDRPTSLGARGLEPVWAR
jgi:Tol biopolymer transport system component